MSIDRRFDFTYEAIQKQRAWVKELRETSKGQTRGRLRANDNFCCLGIYCNMVNPLGWKQHPSELVSDGHYYVFGDNGVNLPVNLSRELGLMGQQVLMDMNDTGFSFKEIADALEVWVP